MNNMKKYIRCNKRNPKSYPFNEYTIYDTGSGFIVYDRGTAVSNEFLTSDEAEEFIIHNLRKRIQSSQNIELDVSDMMKDKLQRRLYGKMMNLIDDAVEPWLQGVLDLAEVSDIDIPGIVQIYNAIQEHGVTAVKEALNRV